MRRATATIHVGHGRSDEHGTTATGVVDTGTGNSGTVAKVTWADVVRKPAVTNVEATKQRRTCGQELVRSSKLVSRGSFSRNKPVNRKV